MKEQIASIVAVASAALASICCLGPLVLVGLGLGGAGFAAGLTQYRPYFLGLTAVLLGMAFYLTYRKREVACADGSCELRSGSKTMKRALWVVTVAALAMSTFPGWSVLLAGRQSAVVSADAETVVLNVSGMTCDACAVGIEKSLMKIPGVQGATVSLDAKEAVVYVEPGQVSVGELLKAVESAGSYTAQVKKPIRGN